MAQKPTILCIIPARGGSKRLPGKNSMPFLGKPLIAYAISVAKGSKYVDRVIVSTDDEDIARVAKEAGAEVPFMRPAELASDTAPTVPVLQHAVEFVEKGGERVDYIVLIQPTVPGVETDDVDAAIEKLLETKARSCITVCDIVDPPSWMYRLNEKGVLSLYTKQDQAARSQDLEKLYRVNGAVYVTTRTTLMEENKIIDNANCVGIIMPRERSTDIDTQSDFLIAEVLMRARL